MYQQAKNVERCKGLATRGLHDRFLVDQKYGDGPVRAETRRGKYSAVSPNKLTIVEGSIREVEELVGVR
jgi:hypothetical protein